MKPAGPPRQASGLYSCPLFFKMPKLLRARRNRSGLRLKSNWNLFKPQLSTSKTALVADRLGFFFFSPNLTCDLLSLCTLHLKTLLPKVDG